MLFLILTFISVVHAASYDPDLTWRVMFTEHFRIHFHGGEEQVAEEMAHVAERAFDIMTEELQWTPDLPTEIVLIDNTDIANGYATYLPFNTIVIYITAPDGNSTLSLYEDWNEAIFTHELTHILHMDTIEGATVVFRKILGKIVAINGLVPGWVIEGQATMQETWQTAAGRGRSNIVHMIKRTTVLTDTFPPLGNMEGFQTQWPGGNLRYLFGQDFMNYIAMNYGEEVWTHWNHEYGEGIPYLLPSKRVFGQNLHPLYLEWKESFFDRYNEQITEIREEGESVFDIISPKEQNCMGASLSPDGRKLIFACSDLYKGANIYISDPDGNHAEIEVANAFARDFTWRSDSQAYAYSAIRSVNRFNLYSDVYLRNLGGGGNVLTKAKRARDPNFSREGDRLLVVTNEHQNNQLAEIKIDQRTAKLTKNTDHTQYFGPKFSPDGRFIVTTVWEQGQQDLWILTDTGQKYRRLTQDVALDMDPIWSPNGERIYFSSDRDGIFNIYAIDLNTEDLYRVTNVITGAFRPQISPDESHITFSIYQHYGYGIARMKNVQALWKHVGKLQRPIFYGSDLASVIPLQELPPLPKSKERKIEDPEFSWWQWRQRKEAESKSSNPLLPHTQDPLHFDGLTGMGSPLEVFGRHEMGYWGLPHEDASGGEFSDQTIPSTQTWEEPNSGPDLIGNQELYTKDKEENEYPFSYPVYPYDASRNLRPTFISPGIFRTAFGALFSASISGTDTLRQHIYSSSLNYRTDSGYIGWSASYAYNKKIPIFSTGIFSYTVPYGNVYLNTDYKGAGIPTVISTENRYWDRRIQAYIQGSYGFRSFQSVFGRWTGSYRSPWIPNTNLGNIAGYGIWFGNQGLPDNAYRPFLPNRGFFSSIGGGWRYVRGLSYGRSISAEDARLLSVVGEIHSPYIGSFILDDNDQYIPFSQVQLTGEWREYKSIPWKNRSNHVFAMKVGAGISVGDSQRYGTYRLGGSFGESGYNTLPSEWRALRGYSPAQRSGNSFYLSSFEYRMPLVWLDRGFRTVPLFLRYVSASIYMDVGHAFDDFNQANQIPMIGLGAELKGSIVVSWGQGLTVRGGYGFAPRGDGIPIGSLDGFYLWLGSSF